MELYHLFFVPSRGKYEVEKITVRRAHISAGLLFINGQHYDANQLFRTEAGAWSRCSGDHVSISEILDSVS